MLMLAFSLLLFVGLEAALQIRSHIRYGQSIFNILTAETRYVIDENTGLKVLRQNHVFHSKKMDIRTNDLGLRSDPVSIGKPSGSYRIAVIGASTVMGAYASTNEETFSYRLQALLNENRGSDTRQYEVINAGIAGYGLDDQKLMIERLILPLKPDLIIVYPGFNDFGTYCQAGSSNTPQPPPRRTPLHQLDTPSWLLSMELIQKNTVALRTPPANSNDFRSVASLDLAPYQGKLEALLNTVKQAGVPLLLATNARAYRPDQPIEEQLKLSETARFYNPCFDLDGLHTLYDLHNEAITQAARRHDVSLLELGTLIPGGREYFVDASHFSNKGEELAAQHLYRFLLDHIFAPAN